MTPSQIPFNLTPDPAYRRADFFAAGSNKDALAWIDRWPDWPSHFLLIYGPKGCGKTHMLAFWRQAAESKGKPFFVIDDIDLLMGDQAQEEQIFHLYNRAKEEGGYILAAAQTPQMEWPIKLPDLASRLKSAPAVSVGSPDDDMMAVVLSKLFSDRQIAVSPDVIQFIVTRLERSFAAMQKIVAEIDRRALSEKRAVTIPLVREILSAA